MKIKLPRDEETRVIKRFALFPVQVMDVNDNYNWTSVWLETYTQKQTARYEYNQFVGWKNDYYPTINERGV